MHDVHPDLAAHWDAKAAEAPKPYGKCREAPQEPTLAVRQQAMGRFVQDEIDAHVAAQRVLRSRVGWDVRAVRWLGRWPVTLYEGVRGFLSSHAAFVSAQEREYRLTACRGCSYRKDRGDGLLYCVPMLASCKCPVWLLACLWWVTKLRRSKCPIAKWEQPKATADKPAPCRQKQKAPAKAETKAETVDAVP